MKILVLALAYLASYSLYPQDKLQGILPLVDGKVTYTEVVFADSVPKEEMYRRIRRWFTDNYRSGKEVIEIQDEERGELVGKGTTDATWMVTFYSAQPLTVWHTLSVHAKDGRFKYTFTDFRIEYHSAANQYGPAIDVDETIETWLQKRPNNLKKIYPQIDADVQEMITKLKAAARAPSEEDW